MMRTKSASAAQEEGVATPNQLRVTVVGALGVGKSALVSRFTIDLWVQDFDPTIEDTYRKMIMIDGKPVTLNILDTAGQEEFVALQDGYMRVADVFIIVFAIDDPASLLRVDEIYKRACRVRDTDAVPAVIYGSKLDLEPQRQVSYDEAKTYADSINRPLMEGSAKDKIRVDEPFFEAVRQWRTAQPAPLK